MIMAFGTARREGATRTENNLNKTEAKYTNASAKSTMLYDDQFLLVSLEPRSLLSRTSMADNGDLIIVLMTIKNPELEVQISCNIISNWD